MALPLTARHGGAGCSGKFRERQRAEGAAEPAGGEGGGPQIVQGEGGDVG